MRAVYRAVAGAGLAGCAVAPALAAQTVRGVVDGGAGAVPPDLTAALVTPAGERVAPRLVGPDGRFTLTAPSPGTYRVVLYRVGFQRVTSAPVALAAGAEPAVVRLRPPLARVRLDGAGSGPGAAVLEGVRVTAARGCAPRPDAARAAVLWGEVRKALDAAALALDAGALDAATAEYWREIAPGTGRPRRERRVESWARVRTPFVTRPAAELLGEGFVRAVGDSLEAYVPDARLLLDPAFLATHCFGVRESAAGAAGAPGPDVVGLTFAPARPGGVPGVRGVLWVDRATAELRSLAFDYVGLPGRWAALSGPLAAAGGTVTFARLPSGLWVVRRWVVRVPRPAAHPLDPAAPVPRYAVESVWEVGGELVDARRVASDADAATPAALPAGRDVTLVAATVRVLDARGRPLPSATAAVDSGAAVSADAQGRVAFEGVPAGPRRVRVTAPGFTPFDTTVTLPALADLTLTVTLDSAGALADSASGAVGRAVSTLAGAARDSAAARDARRVAMVQSSPLAGFERRRRSGLGSYLTRADVHRRRPRSVEDVFRGQIGLVVDGLGVRTVRPGFGANLEGNVREPACYPAVFVDGTRVPPGLSAFGNLTPDDLEGVEIYRGVGVTPPEFAGSGGTIEGAGCGALVLWTRHALTEEGEATTSAPAPVPPAAPPTAPGRSPARRSGE